MCTSGRRGFLFRFIALGCAWLIATTTVITPAFAQTSRAKPQPRPAQSQAQEQQTPRDDTVLLNFVNADIDAVVRAIGQFTGRTFVIDPRVKGTLSLSTERPVTRQQAYEQLLTALRLQGFTIVQTGNVARVVPEADAKLQGGAVIIPRGAAPSGDQLVTQVFRLQYESATAMVPILRPLIAPNNTISAYPQNNTLVITDYADNLRRIQRIIESIDTPATSDVELIQVKNGLALEIATVVNRVLDEGARAAGQATDAGQRISLLAEPRTNSIIIRAPSPQRLQLAKGLIAQLDQPALTPGNINVIHLRNAEAVRLAPLLRAIIGADASFVPQGGGGGLSATTPSAPSGGAQPGLSLGTAGSAPGAGSISAIAGGGGGAAGGLAGMIQADPTTNSLIITAPEPLFRNIRAIVEKLDGRRAQVVIESLIVEVTADKAAEFGIQWQALSGLNDSGTAVIGGTNFGGSGQNIISGAQNIASLGQGLNLGLVRGRVNIPGIGEVINLAFLARALQTTADANILSTPTIQTLDNEEAKFLVGQNIPLITGSFAQGAGAGAGVNPFQTFERRDIGLQLRVKPQISAGGVVRLAIYQELSSIQNTLTAAQGGIITNKRSFESTVLVEDGNIVVLGGLIEDRTDNSKSGVPVLSDIPFVGGLFRYENRGRRKTNLLVFLRPYVVRDESTSSALALDRYDYIRGQVAAGSLPDTLVFRDLQGKQLPASPVVPPSLRKPGDGPGSPATGAPAPGAEPAPLPRSPEAGLGARVERIDPPAPIVDVPPLVVPDPVPAPAPVRPSSAAPAPIIAAAPTPRAPEPTPIAPLPVPAEAVRSVPMREPAPPPTIAAAMPSPTPAPVPTPAPAPMPAPMPAPPPIVVAPPPVIAAPPPSPPAASAVGGAAAPSAAAARTESAPVTARPSPSQPGSSQLLQVAAVSDIARGRDLQRQLRAAGMDAYWESVSTKQGGDVVRVRVTVDPATQTMADAIAKLKSMGFDPIIVTP